MGLDPREYLNDPLENDRNMLESWQSKMWTAMPCEVVSVDLAQMTCVCQPTIQARYVDPEGDLHWVDLPQLQDVPICFPAGGGFIVTVPLTTGDEVLVVFASRCIDSWWQSGGYFNLPLELRMHDLSDGFAIPGPRSQPNVFPSISSTDLQIRNLTGTTFLSIGADGKIGFANAITTLNETLTAFQNAMATFMGVLAAFSGASAPVTQTMLQVPAAAAETALAAVLVDIGALLK